jgi:hypothetical protein
MRRRAVVACFVCLAGWLTPGTAGARKEQAFRYPFVRVWDTAVRLVRVDLESPIGEKSREDGYFLFEFPNNGKAVPGSLEVVRIGDNEVRVVVQVPAMPTYVEQMILDKLQKKLTGEYGLPVLPPAKDVKKEPAPTESDKAGAKKPAPTTKPGDKTK